MVIGGIVGAQVVKNFFFGIGAAIWKWNFNGITLNVLRVLAKDAQCRRVDKTVFIMVVGGIVGDQVVKIFFGIEIVCRYWLPNAEKIVAGVVGGTIFHPFTILMSPLGIIATVPIYR